MYGKSERLENILTSWVKTKMDLSNDNKRWGVKTELFREFNKAPKDQGIESPSLLLE